MEPGKRQLDFFLAGPERRLLRAIAERLPRWVVSDHLTALGVVGSVGAGLGYALSTWAVPWLWLASAMLAVQWFGDSLDGTLARARRVERPRYGYYLDHITDAFSTLAIGVGLGLSPLVDMDIALVLVAAYLALSINVYLESSVFGVFRLAYGRLGPTEVRIVAVAFNTVVLAAFGARGEVFEWVALGANLLVLAVAAGMLAVVAVRLVDNLKRLAAQEPLRP